MGSWVGGRAFYHSGYVRCSDKAIFCQSNLMLIPNFHLKYTFAVTVAVNVIKGLVKGRSNIF